MAGYKLNEGISLLYGAFKLSDPSISLGPKEASIETDKKIPGRFYLTNTDLFVLDKIYKSINGGRK